MTREDAILHMVLRREELKHSVGDLDEDIKAFDMAIEALEQEPCEMTAEEYRQRMIQAFHNAGTDELIAVCVLPTAKEFEYLEWLLKNHYKKEPCEDAISRQAVLDAMCDASIPIVYKGKPSFVVYYVRVITDLPSVSTKKTGRWIMPVQDDGMSDPIYYQVRCSECGFDLDPQTWHQELHQYGADRYCPKCGTFLGGDNNGYE